MIGPHEGFVQICTGYQVPDTSWVLRESEQVNSWIFILIVGRYHLCYCILLHSMDLIWILNITLILNVVPYLFMLSTKVPEFNFISSEFIVVIKKLFKSAEPSFQGDKNLFSLGIFSLHRLALDK